MKRNKKVDQLRVLLQQVELPAPPQGFTEEVMKETSSVKEDATFDIHLKTIFQDVRLSEPNTDFTYNVQKGIRALSQQQRSKPIITRGVWITIALFVITCVGLVLASPSHDVPTDAPVYFSWLGDRVIDFTTSFREPILYFEAIILSAGMLLGLEQVIRKRLHLKNT